MNNPLLPSTSFFARALRKSYRTAALALHHDEVTGKRFFPTPDLQRIGTAYGGWVIPTGRLDADSICYCVGCGSDVSFDLGLIERFGCEVYAFDPTPFAVGYVSSLPPNPKYHFTPVGLWDSADELKFYVPLIPHHDSYSAVNLQHTRDYVLAPVKRLSQIMRELGHTHLDLLKIDVEGAEYRVIDSLLQDDLDIRILCVEFDEYFNPQTKDYRRHIRASLDALQAHGYTLVCAQGMGNYTLVRNP